MKGYLIHILHDDINFIEEFIFFEVNSSHSNIVVNLFFNYNISTYEYFHKNLNIKQKDIYIYTSESKYLNHLIHWFVSSLKFKEDKGILEVSIICDLVGIESTSIIKPHIRNNKIDKLIL
jgi:hypothetical protein